MGLGAKNPVNSTRTLAELASSGLDAGDLEMTMIGMIRAAVVLAALSVVTPALADGDAAAGEKVFAKCKICHQVGETAKNMIGPVLNGVVGRKSASFGGFTYSPAYKKAGEEGMVMDEATIAKWVHGPKDFVPGNKMAFAGLTSDDDIANVIAYLKQFGADGKKQ